MNDTNLLAIFITGLITGGLSCMAVQGGLLATTIAQREEERLKKKVTTGQAIPIFSFLVAKLFAYTLFGLLLGFIGSAFQLSLMANTIMQLLIAAFMIGTALNILNVHPVFRYFVIQPPRFLTRLVRKQSKSTHLNKASRVEGDIFAPAILGALTVFIPCGTTQAMMALAMVSGSPLSGAAILFAFVLGTSPVFFLLGYFATKLGDILHEKFMKLAAFVILFLALFNLNNALYLTGSNFTIDSFAKDIWCVLSYCADNNAAAQNPTDVAEIVFEAEGYNPNNLTVRKGATITLNLNNISGSGCTQSFTIPSLGIQKVVPIGNSDTVTFTAPGTPGPIAFMCSMGMYRGIINVI
jgi:uncharacterized protein